MLNFDAKNLAKGAVEGLKKAEKLAGIAENAPEQMIEALRKLLAEAKKLAAASPKKNEQLEACIDKAQALLDGGDLSMEAVTKLTAELTALVKGANDEKPAGGSVQKTAPAAASVRTAPAAPAKAAPAQKPNAETPSDSKPVQFTDVKSDAYYYEAVQWAVQKGIASGTTETTFSPDQTCTRAQTITLLWRAAGSPAPKSQDNPFNDVKESAYYYNAALWAAERKIISGPAFQPDDGTTRAQMATFLYRNAGSPAVADSHAFTDVPADAYYAKPVAWAAAKGIATGTGEGTFSPDKACTRGQIVTFLYRAK